LATSLRHEKAKRKILNREKNAICYKNSPVTTDLRIWAATYVVREARVNGYGERRKEEFGRKRRL